MTTRNCPPRHDRNNVRVIFFHMPKTGGTTLTQTFRNTDRFWSMKHVPPKSGRTAWTDEQWNRAFKVGMLRNPYDRYVSAYFYFYFRRQQRPAGKPTLANSVNGFEHWYRSGMKGMKTHWKTAWIHYIVPQKGQDILDHYYRMEDMDENILDLSRRMEIEPPSVETQNVSQFRPTRDWRPYYKDASILANIHDACAWEFEKGGYEKIPVKR